ncbi:hypothetical protein [Acinetobacter sp. YH01009]|uniref:hypothetical protein n=1 Tax=Acinetobacter TaxID=469 RepID=UPI0015D3D3C9|nr:hypothetical protein [Acinetobacter sp. YH01009]
MPEDSKCLQQNIYSACYNAVYVKSEYEHIPYITQLINKYGAKVADIIPSLIEMFHLISKESLNNINFVENINFKENTYKSGVYLYPTDLINNFQSYQGLAIVDIPTGSFRNIVIDSGGGITASKHTLELFKDIKGQYLIPFRFDGIYVHPNCYTYFFIENNLDRLMPLEAFDINIINTSEDMGLNWIEESINYANTILGFNMEVQKTENFIEKVVN